MTRIKETDLIKRRLKNPWHPKYRRIGNTTEMLSSLEKDFPGMASWFLDQVPQGTTVTEYIRSVIMDLHYEEVTQPHENINKQEI